MTNETAPPVFPAYNPSEKQKGASKTARIPIKIIPIERLPKPEWIRVKAASPSSRFNEIKDILRANGCTYHGVALNVAMDLVPFGWINPCGYADLATVDMRTLGVCAPLPEVQLALAHELIAQLFLP